MVEVNQSTVKTIIIHQSKINVVKFNGTNNWKGKEDIRKSRPDNRQLEKNQCAYCKEKGHWKVDCSKLKKKKKSKSKGNIAKMIG